MYGLTASGFVPKTFEIIKAELEESARGAFGENVNLDPALPLGQLIAILAEREAELWEVAQAIYNARNPDAAEDAALDAVCALTGTIRRAATKSIVDCHAIGTNGTVLDAGRVVSVDDTGARFASTAAATISTATSWAPSTAYAVDAVRTNASRVYVCTVAGTSAGSGGPTTTASDITDGGVTWRYLGEGDSFAVVPFEAEETGPVAAASGTITTIETPVGGWETCINLLDADEGRDRESNAALRLRREEELAADSNSSVPAIREKVLAVEGVTSCRVFNNTTMTTDADGMPPKSVEVLVRGGVDADVAEAVFRAVGGGIEAHGTTDVVVTDSQGNEHTVGFTRPVEVPIYIDLSVTVSDDAPSDWQDQIRDAIVAWGDLFEVGADVYASAVQAQCFKVAGVLNVAYAHIGIASNPSAETTVTVGARELATFDTSRISFD